MKQSETNIGKLAAIHGLYYCATGIWPLLHIDSFLLVTGPKTDLWLVKTVGVLVLAIGVGLLASVSQQRISFPLAIIAMETTLSLILIDAFYVWEGVISPVYLLDALLELILFSAWIFYTIKNKLWESA